MTTTTLEKKPTRMMRKSTPYWTAPFDKYFRSDLFNYYDSNSYVDHVPALNVRETKTEFVAELAAPGLKREDFDINVEGRMLTITCETESRTEEPNEVYTCTEYDYTRFSRTITLPDFADTTGIKAEYTNGILRLSIPKKSEPQKSTQKITVR